MAIRYEVLLTASAVKDQKKMDASERKRVFKKALAFLESEPDKEHGDTVRKMKHIRTPQFRLRVGDYRIYYDVEGGLITGRVYVLGIVHKKNSEKWLKENAE